MNYFDDYHPHGKRYKQKDKPTVIVVTRHPALVQYLQDIDIIKGSATVLERATAQDVLGKHVIGKLPYGLAALCNKYTEVRLEVPRHLRGFELTVEDVAQYASIPRTYRVREIR